MKEEDIRPESLMRENEELHEEDVRALPLHKDAFIVMPCPACETRDYTPAFTKQDFTFVTCNRCETLFINPRPTLEMLNEYYAVSKSINHWNDKIFPASEDARRNQIFVPRAKKIVELCNKHSIPMKVLVDVGAGFGTFCEEIKKLSVFDKIIAVEPSHALAETCRGKGLDVVEKPIENIKEAEIGEVSVITSFELIEHLYRPKDFLLSCNRALPTGGVLILTTPNIKGFDLLVLGKKSDNIDGPNHLNYFHPESLERLLRTCGFEVIGVETPGKLDAAIVRNKILAGDLAISDQPFLEHVLINQWETIGDPFQRFLSDHGLSSHLWMVARKV